MDDMEPNNKNRDGNVLQTKEQKHEGQTLQQRHDIKTGVPLLRGIFHLLCNEQKIYG